MKQNISKYDFRLKFSGYGHYVITYTSPATGTQWKWTCSDMTIIDKLKEDEEDLTKAFLNRVKKLVKTYGYKVED